LEGTISDAAQFAVADADAARLTAADADAARFAAADTDAARLAAADADAARFTAADADATRGVTECYGCSAKRYVDGYSYAHASVSKCDACADVNLDYHAIVGKCYADGDTNDDASSDADAGPVDGCAHGYGCTRET
jgi:hypothetical protein